MNQAASSGSAASLEAAGRWLLESGIRDSSGGVARYYRIDEGRNLPISNEITGYTASACAYLYQVTGEPDYLGAARAAARFLTGVAWRPELDTFPFECAQDAPSYFFDCGIIVRGLLAVWRLTGEPVLLRVAEACGRSMARDFLTADAIHPVISLPDRTPLQYEARWSREPGCFQLKAALAWRELAAETGDGNFSSWWEQALAMSLATYRTFLPGSNRREDVMDRLHAYCYFLEALLFEPSNPAARDALGSGIATVASYLREIAPVFARSDVHAQLLRVRLHAGALDLVPLKAAEAEEEAAAIKQFQYKSPDPHLDGGFCFGRNAGGLLPFANPVSTAFCLQALEMWRQRLTGELASSLDVLI